MNDDEILLSEPPKMSVAEFRRLGYLQELNRKFLHPLGLALEIEVYIDGTERFGAVWDCRDYPDGMLFDDSMLDDDFKDRVTRIHAEWQAKAEIRVNKFGWVVQPAEGVVAAEEAVQL